MKPAPFILIAAALLSLAIGCSTTRTSRDSITLQISGIQGTAFTANYRTGERFFTVGSVLQTNRPAQVLLLEMPGKEFTCEVSKHDPDAELTVEILRGNEPVFRADAPAGTEGVRITNTGGGWEKETY